MIPEPFDHFNASQEEYAALTRHQNRLQSERLPEEPAISIERTVRRLQSIPPFVDFHAWVIWNAERTEVLASGHVDLIHADHNQHVAESGIEVLPEARGRGLGTALLRGLAQKARDSGRRLLVGETWATIPAGEAFMRRIGGTPGLVGHMNELDLSAVDRDLLKTWQERARDRAAGFELGEWTGPPYPEEELDGVVAMLEATNLAPRGDLDVEDFHWTPDQIRENDRSLAQRAFERWTLFVRDPATREMAGFTEVFWSPDKPDRLEQGWTAVLPKYRNRGLGRWLKAAMIEKVLGERPQVRRIQTGNADSNAAMLSINRELGFKPYVAQTLWQVELSRVDKYLEEKDQCLTPAR
jgi:GNAT superfamily N-acetyltransferase